MGEERVLSGEEYIYRYRWEELSKARVLSDMLDIRTFLGVSLIETGRINSSHITVGSSNGNHYIRINPPDHDYNPGSYEISIEEFAKYEDASLIYASSNRDEYAFGANKLSHSLLKDLIVKLLVASSLKAQEVKVPNV